MGPFIALGVYVVAKALTVLQESLQLQGARGLDLERASSGDTSDEELPELRLNICLVSEVFVQVLATGVGTLAFIWATVVLLGGFSAFLHKVDFWVITGIIFVQAAKIVGVNSNTEAKFFAEVPPAFLELGAEHFSQWGRRRPLTGDASGRNMVYYIMLGVGSAWDLIGFMALLTSVLLLLPLVAGSSCIALSIFRLLVITRHGNYGSDDADGSNPNVLSALIFFYALVLAQGGLFLISMCILLYRLVLTDKVCSQYQFEDKDRRNVVDKYISRTSSACIKTGVLNTINRKLVSFAVDLLHSEYSQDRLSGVLALHSLTSKGAHKAHKERALAHIQSSPDCIARMLVLLSSKSAIDEYSKVKLAHIVTELASELRLSDIDRATESISSLIDPYLVKMSTQVNGDNNGYQTTIDVVADDQQGIDQSPNTSNRENICPLIIHGLMILAKLAGNPDNCAKIYGNEILFSKITVPISNKLYQVLGHDNTANEITEKSLQVVSKLVKGTCQINRNIRQEICSSGLVLNCIYPILTSDKRYDRLKVPAIKILSKLDLVNIVGDENMVDYMNHLMALLFNCGNDSPLKNAAAKALVSLTMDSTTYCGHIINGSTATANSVVQELCSMLHHHRSCRNAIAHLLRQFCVYCRDDETRKLLRSFVKSILFEVSKVIYEEADETVGIHESNSQQPNQRPAETIRQFCIPHIDTSSFASRRYQRPALAMLQANRRNQTESSGNQPIGSRHGTENGSYQGAAQGILSGAICVFNRFVNVPGACNADRRSSTNGDNQQARTLIQPGRRKTLVAFLDLAVQTFEHELIDADGFSALVPKSGSDQFVEKLKEIIEMCSADSIGVLKEKRSSADYLMMMKSVAKLCRWVMKTKQDYVVYFQQKEVDQKLKDGFQAMRGLELAVVLTCSPDEMLNYQTLSSIVEDASRQMQPNVPM